MSKIRFYWPALWSITLLLKAIKYTYILGQVEPDQLRLCLNRYTPPGMCQESAAEVSDIREFVEMIESVRKQVSHECRETESR